MRSLLSVTLSILLVATTEIVCAPPASALTACIQVPYQPSQCELQGYTYNVATTSGGYAVSYGYTTSPSYLMNATDQLGNEVAYGTIGTTESTYSANLYLPKISSSPIKISFPIVAQPQPGVPYYYQNIKFVANADRSETAYWTTQGVAYQAFMQYLSNGNLLYQVSDSLGHSSSVTIAAATDNPIPKSVYCDIGRFVHSMLELAAFVDGAAGLILESPQLAIIGLIYGVAGFGIGLWVDKKCS